MTHTELVCQLTKLKLSYLTDIYNFVNKEASFLYMTSQELTSFVSMTHTKEIYRESNAFHYRKKYTLHLLDVLYCQLHDSRGSMDQTTVNNINR